MVIIDVASAPSSQVVERDLLLQEKEKLYKEMKDILARQVDASNLFDNIRSAVSHHVLYFLFLLRDYSACSAYAFEILAVVTEEVTEKPAAMKTRVGRNHITCLVSHTYANRSGKYLSTKNTVSLYQAPPQQKNWF